jgi:hypothetical protein
LLLTIAVTYRILPTDPPARGWYRPSRFIRGARRATWTCEAADRDEGGH